MGRGVNTGLRKSAAILDNLQGLGGCKGVGKREEPTGYALSRRDETFELRSKRSLWEVSQAIVKGREYDAAKVRASQQTMANMREYA